jgi:hypothetical protein
MGYDRLPDFLGIGTARAGAAAGRKSPLPVVEEVLRDVITRMTAGGDWKVRDRADPAQRRPGQAARVRPECARQLRGAVRVLRIQVAISA